MSKNIFSNFKDEILYAIEKNKTSGEFMGEPFEIEFVTLGKMNHGTVIYYRNNVFNLVGDTLL